MGNKELITVLMSVHNGQDYLEDAIRSILGQSYAQLEFIIINDGSTDTTEKIILSFSDARIVYVKNSMNLGLIASLNKGLQMAKGSYIARMDADDLALPARLEEQWKLFKSNDQLVAVSTDYYFLKKGRLRKAVSPPHNDSDYLKTILLFSTCFSHPTVMMKNVFQSAEVRYDENFLHTEDYRLWTVLAGMGTFGNINAPLLKYRVHASQITVKNRESQFLLSARIRKDYLDALGFNYTDQQLNIHNRIGNNEFVRSPELLLEMEQWLKELVKQNERRPVFRSSSFNRAVHKYWLDVCGNTNLGLKALGAYFRSDLSRISPLPGGARVRLLIKCVLRSGK